MNEYFNNVNNVYFVYFNIIMINFNVNYMNMNYLNELKY